MATYKSIVNRYYNDGDAQGLGVGDNANQIAFLFFKLATQDGIAVFDLDDGFSDEYEDETGVDTSASTNESYDSSNDLYSVTGNVNLTLISGAQTAEAAPTHARIVIMEEDVDACTPNTDIRAYASRDNGTTYTQITLTDEGDYQSGRQVLAGYVDISAQPSGTNMRYKITGQNNKDFKIHGTSLMWSVPVGV